MKTLIKATVVTLALSFTTLYAGGGHSHDDGGHSHAQKEISKADVEKTAKTQLARLIKNNRIDQSWSNAAIKDMQKKKFNSNEEWMVSFMNDKIEDNAKQTLYIFVNKYGEITGVNHTGK